MIDKLNPKELNYLFKIYLNDDPNGTQSSKFGNTGDKFGNKTITNTMETENTENPENEIQDNFYFIPNVKSVINTKMKKPEKYRNSNDHEIYALAYLYTKDCSVK